MITHDQYIGLLRRRDELEQEYDDTLMDCLLNGYTADKEDRLTSLCFAYDNVQRYIDKADLEPFLRVNRKHKED